MAHEPSHLQLNTTEPAQPMRNAPTSTEEVYALLCALRDTYDYGAINPVLSDDEFNDFLDRLR